MLFDASHTSYDTCKPLVVIWDDFLEIIKKHTDLKQQYSLFVDICSHHVLLPSCSVDYVGNIVRYPGPVWSINKSNECVPCYLNLDLKSVHYKQELKSGDSANVTAYFSATKFTYYTIADSRPRYLIWPVSLTSPINATYIDRVDLSDLLEGFQRSLDWALLWYRNAAAAAAAETSLIGPYETCISQGGAGVYRSIVVIDLDSTCIKNCDNSKIQGIDQILILLRQRFDIMVLWSHGSSGHVEPEFFGLQSSLFDLILCNEHWSQRAPKNLLFLYNYFPNVRFTKSLLIDDLKENATPEYSIVILPLAENTFAIRDLIASV